VIGAPLRRTWDRLFGALSLPPEDPAHARSLPFSANPLQVARAILVLAIVLRLVPYLENPDLFSDEATLALQVVRNDLAGIVGEGNTALTTPPLFLLLVKGLLTMKVDPGYPLRLPSFLAGIFALPLFYRLARRILRPREALTAFWFFSISVPLIYYTVQDKQYMLDVLLTIVLLLLALRYRAEEGVRPFPWGLFATGITAMGLSFLAALPCAGIGTFLFAESVLEGRRRDARNLALAGTAWTLVSIGIYLAYLRPARELTNLEGAWTGGMLPFPPHTWREAWLYLSSSIRYFRDPLDLPEAFSAMLLVTAGAAAFYRRSKGTVLLLFSPLLAYFAVVAAHVFPVPTAFEPPEAPFLFPSPGRLLLFTVPPTFLFLGFGLWNLVDRIGSRFRLVAYPAAFLLMAWPLPHAVADALFPPWDHGVSRLVDKMRPLVRPGDAYFVQAYGVSTVEWEFRRREWDVPVYEWNPSTRAGLGIVLNDAASMTPGQRFWVVTLEDPVWHSEEMKEVLMGALKPFARPVASVSDLRAEAELLEAEGAPERRPRGGKPVTPSR
jgi:hypothetical protein